MDYVVYYTLVVRYCHVHRWRANDFSKTKVHLQTYSHCQEKITQGFRLIVKV